MGPPTLCLSGWNATPSSGVQRISGTGPFAGREGKHQPIRFFPLHGSEGLIKVGDDVIDILDAHGKTNEVFGEMGGLELFGR